MISPLIATFGVILGILLAILAVIFVGVPVLKVIGSAIAATLRGIGWVLAHLATFVVGMLRDAIRFVGALIATVLFVPLMAGSVVIGRWSSASHFASSVLREMKVGAACLYRVVLQRPLRLLLLDGLLEGVEQRVPEAVAAAPRGDQPGRRTGQFPGYTIVGSLRPGGSGAKLYVAEPDAELRSRRPGLPAQVVIKTFAITDGSSLPQIVRESRALDAARQMGLIVDHGLDEQRFFYVMPYHAGESLSTVARQLHGESDSTGLDGRGLQQAVGYVVDLVDTLDRYHRGGLWHKDVKPENIIVHAGRAHLVDLGLVTPLRSAMTLTTHGTEYFRDPEMVRLALRGVKVHQVDGAKFDIYACGAVLYFLLENTFPAHGGLSAFSRRSPEALRWIVRRAMADYSKRYERADVMLGDLRFVAGAADPFAVRPADLPSVRGDAVASHGQQVDGDARAWSAPPPPPGSARRSPVPPAPLRTAGAARAPRLKVTNWWTGAYAAAGQSIAPSPPDRDAATAGFTPFASRPGAPLTPEAPSVPAAAWTPSVPSRPTAAAQRTAARRRAAERREAASKHVAARLHRPAQPNGAVVAITLLVIALVLGVTILGSSFVWAQRRGAATHARVLEQQRIAAIVEEHVGSIAVPLPPLPPWAPAAPGAPLAPVEGAAGADGDIEPLRAVLVNTHADPAGKSTLRAIDRAIAEHGRRGYVVCTEDTDAIARLAVLLPKWKEGDKVADAAIEDVLEERSYAAIVWLAGGGRDDESVDVQFLTASREGGRTRRGTCDASGSATSG